MAVERFEITAGATPIVIETGRMAKQAGGAVTVTCGGTVVLTAATAARGVREGADYLPLFVDYRERTYAAGKIPGGFFKREGRPRDKETVTARLVDRSIRPLFPEDIRNEIQVLHTVLSHDGENAPDLLAMVGASAALLLSDIPFDVPMAGVRVASLDGEYVVNPTIAQMGKATLVTVVAGTRDKIVMMEAEAMEVPEDRFAGALRVAQQELARMVDALAGWAGPLAKPKTELQRSSPPPEALEARVREAAGDKLNAAMRTTQKTERQKAMEAVAQGVLAAIPDIDSQGQAHIRQILEKMEKAEIRRMAIEEGRRLDGRDLETLRPIECQVGVLPRTHGSALFSRGETQTIAITTLGTTSDEQKMDELEGESYKSFMLHYNFPPFSVGEVSPVRGPGRREIGHGALAEKAVRPMVPHDEKFPYTVRVVSDILESNGSTSMASVCGGVLSMMDAGVPLKAPVAGISIGLVTDRDQYRLLTDIAGHEDHHGDMDFKVAGTREGITAIQLDLKLQGVSAELLIEATQRARDVRLAILDKMAEAIPAPRSDISPFAPRIFLMTVDPDRIRDIIGPGGRMIRKIIADTGVDIDVEDDGRVMIASPDEAAVRQAKEMIEFITAEIEIGKTYLGKVMRLMNFGAFVEILPGKEGLIHISELADGFVGRVEDIVREGDEVLAKVVEVDTLGRINLSRVAALKELGENAPKEKLTGSPSAAPAEGAPRRDDRPKGRPGRPNDRRGDRGRDQRSRDSHRPRNR